jgi:hypothetical protein
MWHGEDMADTNTGIANDCIETFQLQKVGESVIADFDRRLAGLPPDLCRPFTLEARCLTDQLMMIYRLVALCVRSQSDLENVAASWGFMVKTCDEFAALLLKLREAHPACGAEVYHDQVLDLRNKCRRLQEMHA